MAGIPSPIRKWIQQYITGEGSSEVAGQSPVQSVNSQTGDVTISTGGGVIPSSQTVTSYSDLPLTNRSEAEIWFVTGENDIVASTQLSPVMWRSLSDFTAVAADILDDLTWQIAGESYTQGDTTWQDEINNNDVSITGNPITETVNNGQVVRRDDSTDEGLAPAPVTEGETTYGLALTVKTTDDSMIPHGAIDGSNSFNVEIGRIDAGSGELGLLLADSNGNDTAAHADVSINDGNIHYIIINKNDDDPNNWDFYVDSTSSTASATVTRTNNFNSGDYSRSNDVGVWGRNNDGTFDQAGLIGFGTIEYKSSTYNQSEREGFVDRRPEVQ